MKKIENLTEKSVREILNFLYKDELMNVFSIHYFENSRESIGDVYTGTNKNEITEVLHIKDNGSSHFTSFYYDSIGGLEKIAKLIKKLNYVYDDILLAGKEEEIKGILGYLSIDNELYLNSYYQFNTEHYNDLNYKKGVNLRRVTPKASDIDVLKRYLVSFFGAESEEEIRRVTSNKKIAEDLKAGIYFLEVEGICAGMSRFFGESRKYADITSVFIDERYRGKGYGKELIKLMVKQAMDNNKVPILQTANSNKAAKHIYESVGFVKVCDYAFQFIKDVPVKLPG